MRLTPFCVAALLAVSLALEPARAGEPGQNPWFSAGQAAVAKAAGGAPIPHARNAILFIGDGMGIATVTAARIYEGQSRGQSGEENLLAFEQLPYTALSKTYSVTGWRLGYAVAEKSLTWALRTIHDYLTVCAPTPLQRAGIAALALPDSYYARLAATYDRKRLFMLRSLQDLGFSCFRPEGAYYLFADFAGLSDRDDFEFARWLATEAGVAVVPGSSFYENRAAGRTKVRFTFTKRDETLKEAVRRMRKKL